MWHADNLSVDEDSQLPPLPAGYQRDGALTQASSAVLDPYNSIAPPPDLSGMSETD